MSCKIKKGLIFAITFSYTIYSIGKKEEIFPKLLFRAKQICNVIIDSFGPKTYSDY